ncbi:MAG: AAA family ATPase [Symploca sp. SIO1C2]|nr:AAA family ATPase [Symploca sp. SIO1C2]
MIEKVVRNPYIIGRPITEQEMFFGRESLFESIEDNLNNSEHIILLQGQRRIGKSSLLSQIPYFIDKDKFKFVLFDLQDKSHLPLSNILYDLAIEIIDYLDLGIDSGSIPSVEDLDKNSELFSHDFLAQIYQELDGKNLVLLLDEFDVLEDSQTNTASQLFFPFLKSLIAKQDKLFVIPVVGRKLDDMPKLLELFKGAPNYNVGLLDENSTKQLIIQPTKDVPLEYEEKAVQAILELSAGHPYFTQVICFALFVMARDKQQWQITCADVENILDKATEISEAGLVWFWQGLPITERVIFATIASEQNPDATGAMSGLREPLTLLKKYGVETELLKGAARKLVEWGFLSQESENLPYKVRIELVRQWIVKQYSLKTIIKELEKLEPDAEQLYIEADKIYQQGNVQDAIKAYQQVLAVNPNHFSALLQLADRYLDVKEFTKAIECYRRGCKLDLLLYQEGLVRSLMQYGDYLIQQKQFSLAQQQFGEILALEPSNRLAEKKLQQAGELNRKALRSPFVTGTYVPPDQFVGRNQEVNFAFDQIFNSSSIIFYGSLGIGKSSFLKYLADPNTWRHHKGLNIENKYFLIYLDCEAIYDFSASAFWQEIIEELRDELISLKEKFEVQNTSENNNILQFEMNQIDSLNSVIYTVQEAKKIEKNHIKKILKKIKAQEQYLVLLLDNYDATLQIKNNYSEEEMIKFFKEFRHLAEQDYGRHMSAIMTSSQPLSELSSKSIYSDLPSQPLKPFQDEEIDKLWSPIGDQLRKKGCLSIKRDDLQQRVKKVTGGYPVLLQMAGFYLYRTLEQEQNHFFETFASDFEGNSQFVLRGIWQSLNDIERMLLRLIALAYVRGEIAKRRYDLRGVEDFFKEQAGKLKDIERRGIIKSQLNEQKLVYVFTSSVMQQWVVQEIVNNSEAEVAQRERIFSILNRGQAHQIKQAINFVWDNKDNVQSIAGGIRELIPILTGV